MNVTVPTITTDVAVVGAGIVGLSVAYRLAQGGRDVVVIDPSEPGSGASYGNAGTIAPYGCAPVGNPDVLRNLPGLLLSAESPFAMRWPALPGLAPWLLRFLRQSFDGPARHNAQVLAGLLVDAMSAWQSLADEAGLAGMIRHEGCLYAFRKAPRGGPDWATRMRTECGIRQEWLSGSEVARLEPGLPEVAAGLFFPDAAHLTDPGRLAGLLAERAAAVGTVFHRAEAERLAPQRDGGTRIGCADGSTVHARTVVIAAGARSRALARQCGDDIPLDTERGYHIEFAMERPPITRPVSPIEFGFYMTPMAGRLRVAGTVELGGLDAPLNPKRIAFLLRGVRRLFPELGEPTSQWLGFRPSLPDSLPVIGRSRTSVSVFYAFGHGHLGLTLAPATAELIVRSVGGNSEQVATGPFGPQRFGKRQT